MSSFTWQVCSQLLLLLQILSVNEEMRALAPRGMSDPCIASFPQVYNNDPQQSAIATGSSSAPSLERAADAAAAPAGGAGSARKRDGPVTRAAAKGKKSGK